MRCWRMPSPPQVMTPVEVKVPRRMKIRLPEPSFSTSPHAAPIEWPHDPPSGIPSVPFARPISSNVPSPRLR